MIKPLVMKAQSVYRFLWEPELEEPCLHVAKVSGSPAALTAQY